MNIFVQAEMELRLEELRKKHSEVTCNACEYAQPQGREYLCVKRGNIVLSGHTCEIGMRREIK
jgi:hypothetical protein